MEMNTSVFGFEVIGRQKRKRRLEFLRRWLEYGMGVAPAPTARQAPSGASNYELEEGFVCHITFSTAPAIAFWEVDMTPPEVAVAAAIKMTTQFNRTWDTFAPPVLKEMKPFKVNAGYDAQAYWGTIMALVGVPQTITFDYPTNGTVCFYGYLVSIAPTDLKIGAKPMLALTIQPTNYDPVNRVEAGPVFTASGTT